MVPILSILCPKQPLRDEEPAFLLPDLCFLFGGWSLRRRANMPLGRVSTRKSRSKRIRVRTASSRLSLSSDSRNSASSSPSKLLRDWKIRKQINNLSLRQINCAKTNAFDESEIYGLCPFQQSSHYMLNVWGKPQLGIYSNAFTNVMARGENALAFFSQHGTQKFINLYHLTKNNFGKDPRDAPVMRFKPRRKPLKKGTSREGAVLLFY